MREEVWRVITDTPKKRWLVNSSESEKVEEANKGFVEVVQLDDEINNSATVHRYLGQKTAFDITKNRIDLKDGGPAVSDEQASSRHRTNHTNQYNWRDLQKTPTEIICSRIYVTAQVLVVTSLIILMMLAYLPDMRSTFGPRLDLNKTGGKLVLPYNPIYAQRTYFQFDMVQHRPTEPVPSIMLLTWICVLLFTMDLIARAIFCPDFCRWIRSVYTITDLVSLIPFYAEGIVFTLVSLMPDTAQSAADMVKLFQMLDILNVLKICVIGRLFRLLQRQRSTRVLLYTIKTASWNMFMVFELMVLCAVFFGTTVFFFDNSFDNVFNGIYWAFTTMSTTGYGDITPSSVSGHIVAVLCMIIGILLTSYTIPILVNDFLLFYGHADQLAWMRRVHHTATARRSTEKRDLMAKKRINRVRSLLRTTVVARPGQSSTVGN